MSSGFAIWNSEKISVVIFEEPLEQILSPFYHKTGTMGQIVSTKLVLPKWLSYGTFNRVIRVGLVIAKNSDLEPVY